MPLLFPFKTPNSFLSGPFRPTPEPGFVERLGQDLSSPTLKQTLGRPVSGSLQFGAGAIKGLSFGLLDPGEGLQESLDEFGLPDTLASSLDIAGEIGGSFVPFVGSSAIAKKFFTGASLAARLTRGAVTFGGPELARQALTQEFDPRAGVRSLATGAAFALPWPRLALAPAVAGVELALGAEPLEAVVAGGVAGIFGSLEKAPKGRPVEIPPKPPKLRNPKDPDLKSFFPKRRPRGEPTTTGEAPVDVGANVFAENGIGFPGPAPTNVSPGLPFTASAAEAPPEPVINVLAQAMRGRPLTRPQRAEVAATVAGQPTLPGLSSFPPLGGAQTTVDQLKTAALKASGTTLADTKALAVEVERLAQQDIIGLSARVDRGILELGPGHPRTRIDAMALAHKNEHFMAQGALPENTALKITDGKLGPRGINTAVPGQSRRADFARLIREMDEGPLSAQKKGTELEGFVHATTHQVRGDRGRGNDATSEFIAGQTIKMEAALKTEDIVLTTPDSVITLYKNMMAKKNNKAAILQLEAEAGADGQFGKILGESGKSEFRRIAESQAKQLEWVKTETGAVQFRPEVSRRPKELSDAQALFSDAGTQLRATERLTTRGFAKRTVVDSFQTTIEGQNGPAFKSLVAARKFLVDLEGGAIEPRNIHELRMLAFPRLTAVTSNMNGTVSLTQTAEGATPKAFKTLAEATAAIRQQPNLAKASREIGPLTPRGNPPLEGTGTIGSIAGESSHPAATCGVPALSQSPRAKKFRAERESKRDAQTVTLKDLLKE